MRYLILDLETAPIAQAADFLVTDDIEAPSNYKNPEAIAAYVQKEKAKRLEKAALDLDLARIVAFGCLCAEGQEGGPWPMVTPTRTEDDERRELRWLVDRLNERHDPWCLVTFNGHRYDLPLLMRRARYLGVEFPTLNLDRYRSPHVDLYDVLSLKGAVKAHGLRWYLRRLGWTDLLDADPLERGGGDVGDALREGRWEDIAEHCRVDVVGTYRLAQWLGVVPTETVL